MPRKPFIIGLVLSLVGLLLSGVMRASVDREPASPTPIGVAMLERQADSGRDELHALHAGSTESLMVRNAVWILQQRDNAYTLALNSDPSEQRLKANLGDWKPLYELASYPVQHEGRQWFRLVYGAFPTADDAHRELEDLPSHLRRQHPLIKRLGDIKPQIAGDNEASVNHRKVDAGNPGKPVLHKHTGFTISLMVAQEVAEITDFVRRYEIANAWYGKSLDADDTWVSLLYGQYESVLEAQNALEKLPAAVKTYAWVKQLRPGMIDGFILPDEPARSKSQGFSEQSVTDSVAWLQSQPRGAFGIVIARGLDAKALRKISRRLNLSDQVNVLNLPESEGYVLVLGSFDDYLQAQTRLGQFPRHLASEAAVVTFGMLLDQFNDAINSGHQITSAKND